MTPAGQAALGGDPLSPRMRTLMKLLGRGFTNEEIVTELELEGTHHIDVLLEVMCMEAGVDRGEKALVVCLRRKWITISADELGVPLPAAAKFTPRRAQALALFLEGEPNDVISDTLTYATAYKDTRFVMNVMGARNQYHAIAIGHICRETGHTWTNQPEPGATEGTPR